MIEIYLEEHLNRDWNDYKDYTSILGTTMKRKYKYSRPINGDVVGGLSDLQRLSLGRALTCKNLYDSRLERNKENSKEKILMRSYNHKLYAYDDMNELERFGTGKYARKYIVLVSFEDSLDFIYGNMLKTRSNSLIEFCERKCLNYQLYSRQVLGGGMVKNLLMNDLLGFSKAYDVMLKNIGSNDSLEKRLFFMKFNRFCRDLRNSILIKCGSKLGYFDDVVLASIGVSSLVYYSDEYIAEDIKIVNKSYETVLKSLCYERDDYLNVIKERLSY